MPAGFNNLQYRCRNSPRYESPHQMVAVVDNYKPSTTDPLCEAGLDFKPKLLRHRDDFGRPLRLRTQKRGWCEIVRIRKRLPCGQDHQRDVGKRRCPTYVICNCGGIPATLKESRPRHLLIEALCSLPVALGEVCRQHCPQAFVEVKRKVRGIEEHETAHFIPILAGKQIG